jgi:hypothetical protein
VVLPAGVNLYREHALQLDGTANEPIVLAHALTVSSKGGLSSAAASGAS